jgi:hypothetical protein
LQAAHDDDDGGCKVDSAEVIRETPTKHCFKDQENDANRPVCIAHFVPLSDNEIQSMEMTQQECSRRQG